MNWSMHLSSWRRRNRQHMHTRAFWWHTSRWLARLDRSIYHPRDKCSGLCFSYWLTHFISCVYVRCISSTVLAWPSVSSFLQFCSFVNEESMRVIISIIYTTAIQQIALLSSLLWSPRLKPAQGRIWVHPRKNDKNLKTMGHFKRLLSSCTQASRQYSFTDNIAPEWGPSKVISENFNIAASLLFRPIIPTFHISSAWLLSLIS